MRSFGFLQRQVDRLQCQCDTSRFRVGIGRSQHGDGGGNRHRGTHSLNSAEDDDGDDVVHETCDETENADDKEADDEDGFRVVKVAHSPRLKTRFTIIVEHKAK